MSKKIRKQRALAVQRYLSGENPQSICASLGKTKPWLYKWVSRYTPDDQTWCEGQSRRPITSPNHTPAEIEEIVEIVRLSLYNKGLFCGNQAIQWEMTDMEIQPIPSLSTIGRILNRRSLTHRRPDIMSRRGRNIPSFQRWNPIRPISLTWLAPAILQARSGFIASMPLTPQSTVEGLSRCHLRLLKSIINAVYAVWKARASLIIFK